MTTSIRSSFISAFLVTMLLVSVPAVGDEAFTILDFGTLARLDLDDGELAEVGTIYSLTAEALARHPDGTLYAVGKSGGVPENSHRLWILDPVTGDPLLIGPIPGTGVSLIGDMTFGASGALWIAIDGQLHTVDPATAAATPIGDTGGTLHALASSGDLLIGIEQVSPYEFRWRLVTVDPGSGTTTIVAPLPELDGRQFLDMDFDPEGRLWITGYGYSMNRDSSLVFRIDDLGSATAELVFDLSHEGAIEGLAFVPPPAPVDIPTLDTLGKLLLMALLLASALVMFYREAAATALSILRR